MRHTDFTGKDKWAGTLLRLTPGLRYALTRTRVKARAALEQAEELLQYSSELVAQDVRLIVLPGAINKGGHPGAMR